MRLLHFDKEIVHFVHTPFDASQWLGDLYISGWLALFCLVLNILMNGAIFVFEILGLRLRRKN